jgi:hypothetical protein
MEGGFFLIQEIDARGGDRTINGTEYIGFDEDTQTLPSHFVGIDGANFTYTWEAGTNPIRCEMMTSTGGPRYAGPLEISATTIPSSPTARSISDCPV